MSKVRIKVTPFGIFAYIGGNLIEKEEFGKNPEECAKKYLNREEIIGKINSRIKSKADRETEVPNFNELEKLAKERGFSEEEFREFYQKFRVSLTKRRIKKDYSDDRIVIQAVEYLDEINDIVHSLYERLREWYGLYFPEAIKEIEHIDDFLEICGNLERDKVSEKLNIPEKSMGFDLGDDDLKAIEKGTEKIEKMSREKERISNYLEGKMDDLAPNLSKIAGPKLGAKLISLAGGLEKLAKCPASKVQVLGAEKALFRHLRKGSKPPKHGVILQHPMVSQAKKKNRGKMARTLAGKISIAAKVDFYSSGSKKIHEKLQSKLEERAEKLK